MKTIYKYPLPALGRTAIEMPEGAEILSVQTQYGQPMIWAIVDTERPVKSRVFSSFGTGWELKSTFPSGYDFIGTFQMEGGNLVFHLFEVTDL